MEKRAKKTFIANRYQIELTLIGRRFFGTMGSRPGFGIADSMVNKIASLDGCSIQSLKYYKHCTAISSYVSKHFNADGDKPNTPGFDAVFMDVSALRSSGRVMGVSRSVVIVVLIGM